jgi:Iap family predicted aminopeptidase
MIDLDIKKKMIKRQDAISLYEANNKFHFICDYLENSKIAYKIHGFNSVFGNGKNIVVDVNNGCKKDVIITAHYDDKGIYDNCGGVLMLFVIAEKLMRLNNLNYNYTIVFTDQEEHFQQGIQYFLNDFSNSNKIFYHLNIDGLGIGEELIIYNNTNGYFVVDWLIDNEKSILLTDNSPFIDLNIPSLHIFSCYKVEAQEIVASQRLTPSLKKYFNEKWCMENFNEELFEDCYSNRLLNFITSNIDVSQKNKFNLI